MKIWNGYGSEHSMNLVMIGSFKHERDAAKAKDLINELGELAKKEPFRSFKDDPAEARFRREVLEFLMKENIGTIGPSEIEQFNYDVNVVQKGETLLLRTEESDVAAFLKLLIDKGAKVEVFSAHDYPDDI